MRRALLLAVPLALLWTPSALASPSVAAQASAAIGPAPLDVTLTATGDGVSYRWDFGDGTAGEGQVVRHTYAAGAWTATVTATSASGETAQAQVTVAAVGLTLRVPRVARYGAAARFGGRVVPALGRVRVALSAGGRVVGSALTRFDGTFTLRAKVLSPGPYRAGFGNVVSNEAAVRVRPVIESALAGTAVVGTRLELRARLRPQGAGTLRVRIWRSGRKTLDETYDHPVRIRLGTSQAAPYRIELRVLPRAGFAPTRSELRTTVLQPDLGLGSSGPSVLALEQRLAELRYALAGVDASFGADTRDAVYAFQKVHGLERTGRVDAAFWRVLQAAAVPAARLGGDHVEVDKTRQVLFVVREGRVALVVHVSTGATGNTPVGRWHVYSKIPGWSWVLWYPNYFLRGFAIHGYPDVPPYPASHGCVRVPMWVAIRLYDLIPDGGEIDIFA